MAKDYFNPHVFHASDILVHGALIRSFSQDDRSMLPINPSLWMENPIKPVLLA